MELIKLFSSLQVICTGGQECFAASKIISKPKKIVVLFLNNKANPVSYINYCN